MAKPCFSFGVFIQGNSELVERRLTRGGNAPEGTIEVALRWTEEKGEGKKGGVLTPGLKK